MAELSTLGAVIKTAYEGETNTNAYTDAEKSKLAGIAEGATALAIGTTASTAKAGDYQPTWAQVSGKPAVIGAGADAAAARAAIGAGTSSFAGTWAALTGKPTTFPPVVGTGATDAKAGDYQPTWAQVTGKPVGVAVADAVDETDVVAQLNALLASLRTAGFIAA